ncbi:hypothetical protein [Streptacidiphilus sp. MAP5-52]|uniref:hypothetical protein n=1 Tax=Streptacidiphilus sp. MAP5-52 TaxID=3156267 RepID=UPI003515D1DB
MSDPGAPDAVELPPRLEGEPVPDVLVYPIGQRAVLDVRLSGQWRQGIVRERLRFEAGTAYRVMLDPGTGHHEIRTYCWPTGLRVRFVPRAAPAL